MGIEGEVQGKCMENTFNKSTREFPKPRDYPDKEAFGMSDRQDSPVSYHSRNTDDAERRVCVESCTREAPSPIQNRSSTVTVDGATGILRVVDSSSIPERQLTQSTDFYTQQSYSSKYPSI